MRMSPNIIEDITPQRIDRFHSLVDTEEDNVMSAMMIVRLHLSWEKIDMCGRKRS